MGNLQFKILDNVDNVDVLLQKSGDKLLLTIFPENSEPITDKIDSDFFQSVNKIRGFIKVLFPHWSPKKINLKIAPWQKAFLEHSREIAELISPPQNNSSAKEKDPKAEPEVMGILVDNDPMEFIVDTVQLLHHGDRETSKIIWLAALTPKLGYELKVMVIGPTGSGKTDQCECTLLCVPEEKAILLKELSPKAAYYANASGIDFDGVTLFLDDAEDNDSTVNMLKDLASSNRLKLRLWSVDKERQFKDIEINGRFTVIVSAIETLSDKQDQFKRRYFVIETSQDSSLNKTIIEKIKKDLSSGIKTTEIPPQFEIARKVTQAIMDAGIRVIIPFDFDFPCETTLDRTDVKQFIAVIQAVTASRFMQRLRDGNKIFTQPEDFETACNLWGLRKKLKIDNLAEKILEILKEEEPIQYEGKDGIYYDPEPLTTNDVAKILKISSRAAREKLSYLYNIGFVNSKVIKGRGQPYAYWKSHGISSYGAAPKTEPSLDNQTLLNSAKDYFDQNPSTVRDKFLGGIISYLERKGFRTNNQSEASATSNQQNEPFNSAPPLSEKSSSSVSKVCGICNKPIIEGEGIKASDGLGSVHEICLKTPIVIEALADIPLFTGIDMRVYGPIKKGDVLTLPYINAMALIRRHVARQIKVGEKP